MITSINNFNKKLKESLSSDRSNKVKLDMLIQTCREMIDAYNKADEFEALKKDKQENVKTILDSIQAISVIASGVLIEVIRPYEQKRLETKEYINFVETSIDTITKEYKEMHDKCVLLATKTSEDSTQLRKTKNTKNIATGTLTYNEGLGDIIINTFNKIKLSLAYIVSKFKKDLSAIKSKALQFQALTENNINENIDDNKIVELLSKAKEAIANAEKQAYYTELAKSKEELVKNLLKEFKAKSIAIDDKIVSLISIKGGTSMLSAVYQENITNAEIVGESVAEMANDLLSLHTKTTSVSGSVRQYQDDTNSPDGTLNASFDYVLKKVMLSQNNPNHNRSESIINEGLLDILKGAWNSIKSFISNFRISSKKCDNALDSIILTTDSSESKNLQNLYPNFDHLGYDEENNLIGCCKLCGSNGVLVREHNCNAIKESTDGKIYHINMYNNKGSIIDTKDNLKMKFFSKDNIDDCFDKLILKLSRFMFIPEDYKGDITLKFMDSSDNILKTKVINMENIIKESIKESNEKSFDDILHNYLGPKAKALELKEEEDYRGCKIWSFKRIFNSWSWSDTVAYFKYKGKNITWNDVLPEDKKLIKNEYYYALTNYDLEFESNSESVLRSESRKEAVDRIHSEIDTQSSYQNQSNLMEATSDISSIEKVDDNDDNQYDDMPKYIKDLMNIGTFKF